MNKKVDIELSLVDKSQNLNKSCVVIFQKNEIPNFDKNVVAWRVIRNLKPDKPTPFTFPLYCSISAVDSNGNYTGQFDVEPGQKYVVVNDGAAIVIKPEGKPTGSLSETIITNKLHEGSLEIHAYRSGKTCYIVTGIDSGQSTTFDFKPSFYIGVVAMAHEGEILDSAVVKQINTEIDLFGVKSADIIMTGGGNGPKEDTFEFKLKNKQML